MWGLIPQIKRELVLRLHEKHNLSKVLIAKKLGVTKGSITQYMQGKRAPNSGNLREYRQIDKMILDFTEELAKKKLSERLIRKRFCEICRLAQKKTGVC